MKDNAALIAALTSFGLLFSFCGYLSAYAFYNAILANYYGISAPITNFMNWDIMLVQGSRLIFEHLIIGIISGIGFYIIRLKRVRRRGHDIGAVNRAPYIAFFLIIIGLNIFFNIASRFSDIIFSLGINAFVGVIVYFLIYYIRGVFELSEESLQRISSGLYASVLTIFLFFYTSNVIGRYNSIRTQSGKMPAPFPTVLLLTKKPIANFNSINSQKEGSVEVQLLSFKEPNYYFINPSKLTIHGIPKDNIETFQYLKRYNIGSIELSISLQDSIPMVARPPSKGSLVAQAGIEQGDLIITINGDSTKSMNLQNISRKFQGPIGSEVILGIKRKGIEDTLIIKIERTVF